MSALPESSEQAERYERYMEVVRARATSREFDGSYIVPREHYEMIVEAARHAPSGADAQPWHYIVVTDPACKELLAEHFVQERYRRIELGMKFPSPNYRGMATAPGLIVVVADFRYIKAFPVLGDGSDLDQMYQANAERILLQSVAASTMAAHLAAAALGYAVWWVTAIGQQEAQRALRPVLDVPEELSLIDIMCFGPPRRRPYKRWKKPLDEIMSWDRYDRAKFPATAQIDEWIENDRARVMYRDESRTD
ncbi:MAG: nitroreductase family protein [Streptosporangiaceae bacterium]